ncbi:hypothetical protein AVEN_8280-1 [Araneus ventricosus]|uniref:Uncharacterized protein n=1 Tax=Araneus ventricosus TaxID=182803 RepID=A0A4Y2FC31_ARAVE|nr:hypothetical protein AVEN_8280-1 [Araneus ventricosus]
MMMIGSSVDYVRSGGMRNVPVTKAVEHLYATTAKFSGCVILASRPAYSYPPRRVRDQEYFSERRIQHTIESSIANKAPTVPPDLKKCLRLGLSEEVCSRSIRESCNHRVRSTTHSSLAIRNSFPLALSTIDHFDWEAMAR